MERPGLALAGFFDYFDTSRVEVLGFAEHEYLRSFPEDVRRKKIADLLAQGEIPCIILSRDLPVLPELAEEARKVKCPIFRSPKPTTDLMSDLYIHLNRVLAPTTRNHGVLMEVFGVGVLLLLAVLLIPALHGLFLVADLTLAQLGMILGLAVLPTLCIQITRIARGK